MCERNRTSSISNPSPQPDVVLVDHDITITGVNLEHRTASASCMLYGLLVGRISLIGVFWQHALGGAVLRTATAQRTFLSAMCMPTSGVHA
jgi:hypothetical protein